MHFRTYTMPSSWASAYRGKWGQLTPPEIKIENMQKRAVFYVIVYVIFGEQSGKAGVENGAMLTTYFLRYTSECTNA